MLSSGKPGLRMKSQWKVSHGDASVEPNSLHRHVGAALHLVSKILQPREARHGDSQVPTVTKDFTFSQFPFALEAMSPFCTFFFFYSNQEVFTFHENFPHHFTNEEEGVVRRNWKWGGGKVVCMFTSRASTSINVASLTPKFPNLWIISIYSLLCS